MMSPLQSVSIMLVDDHAVVRAGIRRLLEQQSTFSVIAEANSGEQAYQFFCDHLPDVTIMDLTMPGIGGIEAIRRIIANNRAAKILVLSMHVNASIANQSFKAGALGYLTKSGLAEELVNAIETVALGQTYIGADIAKKIAMLTLQNPDDPLQQLTAREFEIFRFLAEGAELEAIARVLSISMKTVSNHQTFINQAKAWHQQPRGASQASDKTRTHRRLNMRLSAMSVCRSKSINSGNYPGIMREKIPMRSACLTLSSLQVDSPSRLISISDIRLSGLIFLPAGITNSTTRIILRHVILRVPTW